MRRELCCDHDLASVASARFSLKSNERQRDLLTLASSHVDFASSLLPWLPALPNDRPTHDRCAPAACSERQSCIAIPTSSRYSSRCPKQLITSPTLSVHGSPDPGYLHYLHTHTASFLPCLLAQGLSASHFAFIGKSSVHLHQLRGRQMQRRSQRTCRSATPSNLILPMANERVTSLSTAYRVPTASSVHNCKGGAGRGCRGGFSEQDVSILSALD